MMKLKKMNESLVKFIISAIAFLVLCNSISFGQKYMIYQGDTSAFQQSIIIEGNDTLYSAPCHSYEVENGRIINLTDDKCKRQGYWRYCYENKILESEGYYNDNKLDGTWKNYNRKGRLIKESVYIATPFETHKIREVDFKDGRKIVLKETNWVIRTQLSHLVLWMVITIGSFWIRFFVNLGIYSNGSLNGFQVFFASFFTFWFSKKTKNSELSKFSNLLSLLFMVFFFSVLIANVIY
jgi:hypothetical protein